MPTGCISPTNPWAKRISMKTEILNQKPTELRECNHARSLESDLTIERRDLDFRSQVRSVEPVLLKNQPFGFLDLPVELRRKVYEYVFQGSEMTICHEHRRHKIQYGTESNTSSLPWAILLTCQDIHNEALSDFCSATEVVFRGKSGPTLVQPNLSFKRYTGHVTIKDTPETWDLELRGPPRLNMSSLRGYHKLKTLTLSPFRMLLRVPDVTYDRQSLVPSIKRTVNGAIGVSCPYRPGFYAVKDKIMGPVDARTLKRVANSQHRRFSVVLKISLLLLCKDNRWTNLDVTLEWDAETLANVGPSKWEWEPWFMYPDGSKPSSRHNYGRDVDSNGRILWDD